MARNFGGILARVGVRAFENGDQHLVEHLTIVVFYAAKMQGVARLFHQVFALKNPVDDKQCRLAAQADDTYGTYAGRCGHCNNSVGKVVSSIAHSACKDFEASFPSGVVS